ncbi:MAG: HNH endonuclease [Pseudobutyrivibrio sp.]|nr:HNH endonuclease [Pseudobutyrivibrio sp.]
MGEGFKSKTIYTAKDEFTRIQYNVVYKRELGIYEIWTYYFDFSNKRRRNKICDREAIAVQNNKEKVIEYINNVLIAEHRNIYSDENLELSRAYHNKQYDVINDEFSEEERIKYAYRIDLEELKTIALKCANHKEITISERTDRHRSPEIASYAKRRAAGVCQLCQKKAPFEDKYGEPFLESHHVKWLSRGGEDSINNVVALCPNCHKKMHVRDDVRDVAKLLEIASSDK